MLVVFEPQSSGHRKEYLEYLSDYARENGLEGVTFVVGEPLLRPKHAPGSDRETEDRRPKLDRRNKKEDQSITSNEKLETGLRTKNEERGTKLERRNKTEEISELTTDNGQLGAKRRSRFIGTTTSSFEVRTLSSEVCSDLLHGPIVFRSWKYYRLARETLRGLGTKNKEQRTKLELRPKTGDRGPKLGRRNKKEEVSITSNQKPVTGLGTKNEERGTKLELRNKREEVSITSNQKLVTSNSINGERTSVSFCFLWLNDVQLFLGLFGFPVPVLGILFKPFIRMEVRSRRDKLIWKRKYWQTRLLVNQKKVKRIWILEDEEAVAELNSLFHTDKFALLHEPVSVWPAEADYDLRQDLKIDATAKVLLHIGTLSTRKGSDEIIRSVDELAKQTSQKITIVMAGKPQPGHEVIIREALESIQEHPHIGLIYKPQYLPKERLQALIEQADGILIPYKNPESSSGILARAIMNRTPVLGVEKGLIALVIRRYQAGVMVSEVDPPSIATGILQLLAYKEQYAALDSQAQLTYQQEHDPYRFAEVLLGRPSSHSTLSS